MTLPLTPALSLGQRGGARGKRIAGPSTSGTLGKTSGIKILFLAVGVLIASWLRLSAQPMFIFEPESQSASLGANVIFYSLAFGPAPITYQWYKSGAPLPHETEEILFMPNVTPADAGEYMVVASLPSGSETSQVATLTIDLAFTKITRIAPVNTGGNSASAAWGDYDNDGFPDLFVARGGTDFNHLYRNNGDGTFTRVLTGPTATDYGLSSSGSWADYDGDGFLDLFVANSSAGFFGGSATNFLYHNNGDGTFTRATSALPLEQGSCSSSAWVDFDRDGLLDLVIGNRQSANSLYRNLGNTVFSRVGFSEGFKLTASVAWADYDNDGDADLLAANGGAGGFQNPNDYLYVNNGDGTFTRLTNGVVVTSGGNSGSCSWVDYDNDGDLDLFVTNLGGQNNALYRNEGDGSFTQITDGPLVNSGDEGGNSTTAAWADYDNDGWLDVFVANDGGADNFLYHNNGNGTFTEVETGSLVNDGGNSAGATWVDYDNDGFPDLFVTNQSGENFLYRNNGNSNAWLKVRLRGTASNLWGVGAKIRVRASFGGVSQWQLREVAARDGLGSPGTLLAEFGLGDATNVDLVRVEWPTGVTQEIENVSVRQVFTVLEPPSMSITASVVSEGDSGARPLFFTVNLFAPTNVPVTVDYFTLDGTALAGTDYLATNGTITINPGETSASIAVQVLGDLDDEPDKTVLMQLTNATILPIARGLATGRILDDDPLALTIGDASVLEGDSGPVVGLLLLSLNKPVDYLVSVDFTNVSSTATAGVDYVKTNGTLVFLPGETNKVIPLTIIGDRLDENNEIVFFNFSSPTNIVLTDMQGTLAIQDDDPSPTLSISDLALVEGNAGTKQALFTVTLSTPAGRIASVSFNTTNGTALAGVDYLARSGSVNLVAGSTNATFFVVINGDTIIEGDEVFYVNLSNPVGALLGNTQAVCRIVDDDFRIVSAVYSGSQFGVRFATSAGRTYRVERTDSLNGTPIWAPVTGAEAVPGTGSILEVIDPDPATGPQRFYRIVLLPE